MRYLMVVLLMPLCLFAQTADQPGVQYASYTLLLVPQKGEGFLVAIDKQQKIVFIPVRQSPKPSMRTEFRLYITASCCNCFGNWERRTNG